MYSCVFQIHCTAVKDKYLYSAGADFTIRAWKLGTLEEHCIAQVSVSNLTAGTTRHLEIIRLRT